MKIYFTCLFALFWASTATANSIDCTLDFARFQRDDGQVLWEIYYSFPDTAARYVMQDNATYIASLYFRVELTASSLRQPVVKEWIVDNTSQTEYPAHTRNLVGVKQFVVTPGEYSVSVTLRDLNDASASAKHTFRTVIGKFSRERLAMSDMQIASAVLSASNLQNSQTNPQFIKNDLYIIPNPLKEFIGDSTRLWLYAEMYNAKTFLHDSLDADYRIYDGARRQVYRRTFRRTITGDTHIETGAIPLENFASGLYYISMTLGNFDSPDTVIAISKFYILNPKRPPILQPTYTEDELFQSSEFAAMLPGQIEEEFQKAKYIAAKHEIELYESLTETLAKQKFMFRFWRERDTDPNTSINEKLEEYRELIRYADLNFSNMTFKQGWKTDKGRILLKYGKPSQIDKYYNIADTRPYEIWFYSHLQGGVQFSFVDKNGNGLFVMVHSTAMGELRNDDWINMYVKIAGGGSGTDLPSTPR
ncbi:hypothetical protein MASR2M18_13930 [Ignavibacteria bacterium]|nr:GWxTD domain-containing protein [Bacteroidota bacterium]MCZ2133211.1 GWxTD domain-containing protein [Bacteroidota bacterium]